jgi:hypothetical protein
LRTAHDLGAAGLLGGSLYGRYALHPVVTRIDDPRERGKVVNAAWRRYGVVNGASLLAVTGGWLAARATEARPAVLSERERLLSSVKDGLVAAVALTGVAAAAEGVRFGRMEPGGAVPLESGSEPASQTPPDAARNKRALNALGAASAAAEAALLVVESLSRR